MKKYIAIWLTMLAMTGLAQLSFQVIDTTTLHSGTSSSTGLLTAVGLGSNVPYSTTNPAYQFHGDLLPAANAKINGNFTQLSTAVTTTNATANGQVAIATNTGGTGYAYYWGTVASGGAVTATNAIASTNGVGTATTIVKGISLGATNVAIQGIGPNAGTVTFPRGLTIEETGPGLTPANATDSGLVGGYGMGEVSGEIGSIEFGSTNDILGGAGPQVMSATIGGGLLNFVGDSSGHGYGSYSVVGGGLSNTVVGTASVISGGMFNRIGDFGSAFYPANGSVIPGGISNVIASMASNSTAAGSQALVLYSNSYVWNDDSAGTFSNTASGQYLIHAASGMKVNTNGGAAALEVYGNGNFSSLSIQGQSIGTVLGYLPAINGHGSNETFSSTTAFSDVAGLLIPNMSSDTTPSGIVSASSEKVSEGFPAFAAFTNGVWVSETEDSPWIQYQFPQPVIVSGFVLTIAEWDGSITIETSMDGVNWTPVLISPPDSLVNGVPQSLPATEAVYVRWLFPSSSPQEVEAGPFDLYGGYINQVTGSSLISITSPFGVSINSTNVSTNTLEVGGDVNATNFSINGVSLLSLIVNPSQANVPGYPYLFITNLASIYATNLNGFYHNSHSGTWTNLNGIPGCTLYAAGYFQSAQVIDPPNAPISQVYLLTTNLNNSADNSWVSTNLIGNYASFLSGLGTNAAVVSLVGSADPAIVSTYSTNATLVAATTLTVNFSPAMPDTSYIVTAPNDLVGVTVTSRGTSSFVWTFTSATFTSQTLEGAVIHR